MTKRMKWLNISTVGLAAIAIVTVFLALNRTNRTSISQLQPQNRVQEGQAATADIDIRPLTEIYANNPPMLTTMTHNAAVLHFESSIPVACSVVFGETAAYGNIASDPNMDGAAIIDHNPIMGGLQPETTYVYRLQGSDAAGILYVSDVMTFTTATDPSADEINIASSANGATISDVSSQFNTSSFAADKAIDDNPSTEWSSAGDGDDAFIVVQFAQPAEPHAIEIWSRAMTTSSQLFTVTVTADTGESLGTFYLDDVQGSPTSHRFPIMPTSPINGIRLDAEVSSGLNTGLRTFGVYAAEATPLALGIK